jgi:hypothetical protein
VKQKTRKDELIKKLAEAGVTATGNYTTVQKLAVKQNLATVEEDLPNPKEFTRGSGRGASLTLTTSTNIQWMGGRINLASINLIQV